MTRPAIPQLLVSGAAAALLVVSLVGIIGRETSDESDSASAPGTVTIVAFDYDPQATTMSGGGTVTWTNEDDFAHTVTSEGDSPLDSGDIAVGGTYEATFDTPGSFPYMCTIHPNMDGVIEVTG